MPAKITVIGLGPGDPRKLTLEADEVLRKAGKVYVRTVHHPTVPQLPPGLEVESFDSIYEQAESFDQTYALIASRLIDLALQGQAEVFYAVPGDPMVGESSVHVLLQTAPGAGVEVSIISGMSFVEPALRAIEVDPLSNGLQLVDAMAFEIREAGQRGDLRLLMRLNPPLDPAVPALISQIYSQRVASAVKLALLEAYPAEHEVSLIRNAGLDSQTVRRLPLYEIDRSENCIDHLTVLFVPAIPLDAVLTSFRALEWIIARLRGPGGCPWDQEQTHQSLKPHLIEETYEVVEALDSGDPAKLSEELGDLLLQVVLHAQVAREAGDFDMGDVIEGISEKLIRRHPHVFGDISVSGSKEVLRNWEEIKQREREKSSAEAGVEGEPVKSLLSGVPRAMPALAYAEEIQDRAARVGFDWSDLQGVLDKVCEELAELQGAKSKDHIREEMGDLLFSIVNVARWLGVDAEESLRCTNAKFRQRFEAMEISAREDGKSLAGMTMDDLDKLWESAKRSEKSPSA